MTKANKQPDRAERFVVELRAVPSGDAHLGRSPSYRLRLGLKRLLRAFGLRAIRIDTLRPGDHRR